MSKVRYKAPEGYSPTTKIGWWAGQNILIQEWTNGKDKIWIIVPRIDIKNEN